MIETLQDFAQTFPAWLQWLAVVLIGAVPFVESYTGTIIGVAIGLHPAVAAAAAIAGNAASVVIVVAVVGQLRTRRDAHRRSAPSPDSRIRRVFRRFGVPGVALLAHPTQISAAAMVGFGAGRARVLAWELVFVVSWGAVMAVLGGLGLHALTA